MIDTHCHLNDAKYEDVDEIVNNFLQAGVEKAICVGWDLKSSKQAQDIAYKYPSVYYAVGVHPDECSSYNAQELQNLIVKDNKLVAVGEIGLDYYHNKENKAQQKQVFENQILIAKQHKLPIIIHCRDAFGDTLEILKKHAPFDYGAVMHCYSGSWEFAKQIISLGVKISFTGSVTFNNAKNLHEVAKNIPLDSFFFETDSPYMTPVPNRGKRNEPKLVLDVARFVAKLRNMDENKLISITDKTAKEFFNL
ncbi:MAG: TatD family hydrolase [Clostridia bacterium]|nr:TatD family hydrolase [Clostridia bacterium]